MMDFRYLVSLGQLRRGGTLGVAAVLLTAWALSLFHEDAPAGASKAVFAVLIAAHLMGVWAYFVWQVLDPARRIAKITIERLVLLFLLTFADFSVFHTTALRADPGAYGNLPAWVVTRIAEWGIGAFLSIETMATLGSGTIPARSPLALFLVGINCFASLAFSIFAAAMIYSAIEIKQTSAPRQ